MRNLKSCQEERMVFDAGLTRIILPYTTCVIKGIEGDFDLPRKEQMPEARYLAYGSSITHGFMLQGLRRPMQ